MFQAILQEYEEKVYKGTRPSKNAAAFLLVWIYIFVIVYLFITRSVYVLLNLAIIFFIQVIVNLKFRKRPTPQQYQDNHAKVLVNILQQYHFNCQEWIDYFLDQCECEKKRHHTNIPVISLVALFISVSNFLIACEPFWKTDQHDQLIYITLILVVLVIACCIAIFLKLNIESFFFPQKNLIESFEEDLKYLRTLYQIGETNIYSR